MATAVVVASGRATKFWLEDPTALFRSINVIPECGGESEATSSGEFYNVLTRLLILGAICMYLFNWNREYIPHVLIGGILVIILAHSMRNKKETFSARLGMRDPCQNCGPDSQNAAINARYELTPFLQFNADNASKRSYMNAKYEVVPEYVPSPFSEVWRLDSSDVTPYTNVPDSYTEVPGSGPEELPPSQTNYITRSSIDNIAGLEHSPENGLVSVRSSVESAFQRDSSEYRNNMMAEYVDYFQARRNYDLPPGFISGAKTY